MIRTSLPKNSRLAERDVTLATMLVAKELEDAGYTTPNADDYAVVARGRHSLGTPDIKVDVDLGRGLRVDVLQFWGDESDHRLDLLITTAAEIAATIKALRDNADDLRALRSQVTAAAKREIRKDGRRGLAYRFVSSSVAAAYVGRDEDPFAIEVAFEMLGRNLRPQLTRLVVESADEIMESFERLRKDQAARARSRAAFTANGATGAIDAVVLKVLRGAGISDKALMERLAGDEDRIVDLEGRDGRAIRLFWDNGNVLSSVVLDDELTWGNGVLRCQSAPIELNENLTGRSLTSVFDNPMLDGISIVNATGDESGCGRLYCTHPMIEFDVKTGRLAA